MKTTLKNIIALLLLMGSQTAYGQVPNDECQFGTFLGQVSQYCSEELEFTNVDATASSNPAPACIFGSGANDVWFSFIPAASAVYVSVSGALNSPAVTIYRGNCASQTELGCNSNATGTFTELTVTDLVIGQLYYLRIDGRDTNVGQFQLCINAFSPVRSPESDCPDAVVLCDKSAFQVENLNQTGNIQNELTGSCVLTGQEGESGSVWYVWTCDQPGTLEFTIAPNNPNNDEEDLDFVVYEMPGGLRDCTNRISRRCMLSGETAGRNSSPCYGATGLRAGETDTEEFAGCDNGSNNFVAPLDMEAGRHYGLIVNNFSSSGFGFSIEFGGTGTFLGPDADFSIEAVTEFDCDKTIIFNNESESLTDPITSYTWNFGAGSAPTSAIGPGPHATEYESFGDKLAAITVETSRGCIVTEIKDFFIEPCCDDLPPLDLDAEVTDVTCEGDENGTILAQGSNGQPEYQYSFDGINYQPSPFFINLPAGDYTIFVQDIKGCEGEETFTIDEPEPIVVFAGEDTIVDLGFSVVLDADYNPMNGTDSVFWSPTEGIVQPCDGCLDPEIFPPGATTYTLTVIDENGCSGSDQVFIDVNIVRPVFAPNVFSPNDDGTNDLFNIFGGPAVRGIIDFNIYDRWGNLVYKGTPTINDRNDGWNGLFKGRPVENGVYVWIANVEFIDNVTLPISGSLTVLK